MKWLRDIPRGWFFDALLLAGAVAFGFALGAWVTYSEPRIVEFVPPPTEDDSRGIRNHNPGNIRHSASKWLGESLCQDDPHFVRFDSDLWGLRAMAVLLRNYQTRHGLETLAQILRKWSPTNENDTLRLVEHVSAKLDVGGFEKFNILDEDNLVRLIDAIIYEENGRQPYPELLIREAVKLAIEKDAREGS